MGKVWPFGKENWCNLEGRYMHMVADHSTVSAATGSDEVSVCSVGVYGTQYVRDGEAVPSSIEIDKGKSTTLSI